MFSTPPMNRPVRPPERPRLRQSLNRPLRLSLGRSLRLLGVLATAAFATGCSWFAASTKPKPAELLPLSAPSVLSQSWSLSIGSAGIGFRPTAMGDSVVAASASGNLVKVDASTGRTLWRVSLPALSTGVGSDGEIAVVGARDGSLLAVDAQGVTKWTAPVGAEIVTVPAVGQGVVVVRGSDNRISAYEVESGKRRWSFARQSPTLTLRQTGGLLIDGGSVYAGLPGGRMLALSLQNGSVRWEAAVSQPRGSNEIERISDVVATPVLQGRDICAVSFQGRVACIETAGGRGQWARDLSSSAGLDMDAGGVYVVDEKDHVHAFSRSGASLWRSEKFAWRELSRPLADAGLVVFGDREGFVHAIRADDAEIVGRVPLGAGAILSGPVRVGPVLVVQTSGGTLAGLRVNP